MGCFSEVGFERDENVRVSLGNCANGTNPRANQLVLLAC